MRNALILLVGIFCFFFSFTCIGQAIRVSEPKLELRGNSVFITYDILNSDPSDLFTVDLVITDADGERVDAKALTGDIGDLVTGGKDKRIVWNLDMDRIEMKAKIYVKVNVKAVRPSEPEVIKPAKKSRDQDTGDRPVDRNFSRTGIILQSVAFPGLGLTRVTGKPHWIKGVAGYGCLAASVIMNRMAVNTYEGISDQIDYDEKEALFQQSQNQDQFSEILAYTAVAVWATDLVWTVIGTTGLQKKSVFSERNGFSLHSAFDPVSSAPLVGITYRF